MKKIKILIIVLFTFGILTNGSASEIYFVDIKKILNNSKAGKKAQTLRQKNVSYQKKRRNASNEWLKKKNEARSKLLTTLNPILQKYMNENNIQIIVDKKNILLANSKFDLTDIILKLLDKELKSIQLN